ncbi:lipopolysaccharide export system protein lptC [Candidatus Photodesmus blepharus]|uniref:Lipopolysaccharide export system protein lptC n=1 Tax=Candidatus Photodesmus blepharonis TaxID=1179155 RepID=A0A084CM45_9GAMM|nr:LPS export ABC transporter periplasmic protein LptC [Candidatus Photodesmus blepharus]KEY90874.1 lipopolysaccharide export system protein lptC [Candidatus Photodesmus blepharus]
MSLSRIVYVLLLFVIFCSAYYLLDKQKTFDIQIAPNQELPMFSSKRMENILYTENGIRSYIITSAHLNHFAEGNTEFKFPVLDIYKKGQIQEWRVTANKATLSKNHILTLYDNVLVENLLNTSDVNIISTEKLSMELDNQNFWTNNEVTLTGHKFKTEGKAMKGNFSKKTALLYKVQSRYENFAS